MASVDDPGNLSKNLTSTAWIFDIYHTSHCIYEDFSFRHNNCFIDICLFLQHQFKQIQVTTKKGINVFNKNIKSVLKLAGMSVFACAAALSGGSASAVTLLGQAPDASVIVQAGGLEWVYAGPCAGAEPSCAVVQLHHDFGFATTAQWNASFSNLSALVAAFNTTNGVRCAATYFNTVYDQCDLPDAQAGYVWNSPLAPSVEHATNPASETFLVRAGAAVPAAVPEPGSLALIGLGVMGFAASRRRRAKK